VNRNGSEKAPGGGTAQVQTPPLQNAGKMSEDAVPQAQMPSDGRADPRPWMAAQANQSPAVSKTPYRNSMARKISASYMRMFTQWSTNIFLLLFVFHLLIQGWLYYDNVQKIDASIRTVPSLASMPVVLDAARPFSQQTDGYAISDPDGNIVLESGRTTGAVQSLIRNGDIGTGPAPFRFILQDYRLWLAIRYGTQVEDGAAVTLRYAADVTVPAGQTVVLFGGGFLLFMISFGIINLQGRFITRRTLRMINELTAKISAITSQNLNLRLNVSDSTDELVDLAITFNKMMERLERSYEKQNRFVSDASHELRTPISVIQGYVRMLDRWGKNDPAILDEAIGAISKESRNMQDLVEKLLFIARNDRGSLVLAMETFDLSELMDELGRETAMLETGHHVVGEVVPGVRLHGDRDRIKQALRVFLDNALKYTEKSGTITLRLGVKNGMAEASVQDTGIGIPEKDLPNVFDRFFRVDEARERNTGGHGLGLSIARIIITRHGGKITVGSKPGAGTRFTLKLPLDREGA
jgi:two-component system sensor histidine kinase ArlS